MEAEANVFEEADADEEPVDVTEAELLEEEIAHWDVNSLFSDELMMTMMDHFRIFLDFPFVSTLLPPFFHKLNSIYSLLLPSCL